MTTLNNYSEFSGRHYETGSLRNVLAYQGAIVPSTGKAISEALLLGLSGGITFGYFTFEYKGYDPQVNLLARNTFDPVETILERLGIPQNVAQSANATKGAENLTAALEAGKPALVWADSVTLPYNAYAPSTGWWAMLPVVVYGYDGETAWIADRSSKPLQVRADELGKARARVKKDKFRVMTLGEPDWKRLNGSVKKSIEQCVRLFTEAPPKGTRENFGFTGMDYWSEMLTNTRNKAGWERWLPPGRRAFSALVGTGFVPGVYQWIMTYGGAHGMDREMYAEFLDQAAALLYKTKLESAAHFFRQSAGLWRDLANQMLPKDTPLLDEARTLLDKRNKLFMEQGDKRLADIEKANARLVELRDHADKEFPWDREEYAKRRAQWSEALLQIKSVEALAVGAMQAAIA